MQTKIFKVVAIAMAMSAGVIAPAAAVTLKVSITNNSGVGGLVLTPLLSVFQNGTFDTFNVGSAASAGLEALAEDGNPAVISAALQAAQPNSQSAVITAPQGFAGAPLIEPGETGSTIVNVNGSINPFFSFLSMILPSNDQFIGNGDPTAYRLFDAAGNFLGPRTINVTGLNAYDAGTEVNNGLGSPFAQVGPGAASNQNGVVSQATGINNFAGLTLPNGQVLDLSKIGFAGNGNFDLATITITAVPVPAALPLMLLGFGTLGVVARRRKTSAAA